MNTSLPPPPSRPALPSNIRTVLQRLARKDLLVKVARFPLLALSLLPLFWLAQGVADFVFELPWAARLLLLLGNLTFAVWLFHRHVWIPVQKRLDLRGAALLIERSFSQFRTGLVATVEFTTIGDPPADKSAELVHLLIGRTSRQVEQSDILQGIIKTRPLWKLLGAALASLALFAALLWQFHPHSLILARRVFLSGDALPRRTIVLPVSSDMTVNTGADLQLSTRATGVIPKTGRLILLYPDGRTESVPAAPQAADPSLFAASLKNVLQPFRYRFELNDGTGPQFQVSTRTLPSLARTRFIYFPPSYTGRPETELSAGSLTLLTGGRLLIEAEATQPLRSATLDLKGLKQTFRMDSGDDLANRRLRIENLETRTQEMQEQLSALQQENESAAADLAETRKNQEEAKRVRDAAPPGDEQRRLNYRWELAGNALRENQARSEQAADRLKRAKSELEQTRRNIDTLKKDLEKARAESKAPDATTADKQKRLLRAEVSIPAEGLSGLSMHLINEEGLESEDDPVYRINIVADKLPTVEITEPKSDQKTVESNTSVRVVYSVRDDIKIEKITLWYVAMRLNAEGQPEPAEKNSVSLPVPTGATTASGHYVINLASFVPPLIEGCTLSYWIEAKDHQTLYSDNAGFSRKMNLLVVSPEQKKAELMEEMSKSAIRIKGISDSLDKTNEKTGSSLRQ